MKKCSLLILFGGVEMRSKKIEEGVVEKLLEILHLTSMDKEEVQMIVAEIGLQRLIYEVDSTNLSEDVKEKVNALRDILIVFEGDETTIFLEVGDIHD